MEEEHTEYVQYLEALNMVQETLMDQWATTDQSESSALSIIITKVY